MTNSDKTDSAESVAGVLNPRDVDSFATEGLSDLTHLTIIVDPDLRFYNVTLESPRIRHPVHEDAGLLLPSPGIDYPHPKYIDAPPPVPF